MLGNVNNSDFIEIALVTAHENIGDSTKNEAQDHQIIEQQPENLFLVADTDTDAPTIRSSARSSKPPIWHKDYVFFAKGQNCKYAISNHMSYDHLFDTCQCFLTKVSSIKEPTDFSEAKKD